MSPAACSLRYIDAVSMELFEGTSSQTFWSETPGALDDSTNLFFTHFKSFGLGHIKIKADCYNLKFRLTVDREQ